MGPVGAVMRAAIVLLLDFSLPCLAAMQATLPLDLDYLALLEGGRGCGGAAIGRVNRHVAV